MIGDLIRLEVPCTLSGDPNKGPEDYREVVYARDLGNGLALHRSLRRTDGEYEWQITHIPTGRAVPCGTFDSEASGLGAAAILTAAGDWQRPYEALQRDRALKEAVLRVRNEHVGA
jgi:hypothetical protein